MSTRKNSTRSMSLAIVALIALGYGLVANAAGESEGEVQATTASATAPAEGETPPDDASELGDDSSANAKNGKELTARPSSKYSAKNGKSKTSRRDRWAHTKEMEETSKRRLRQALLALDLVQARLTAIKQAEKSRAKDMKASKADQAAAMAARGSREQIIKKLAGVYAAMKVQRAGPVLQELDPETASDVLANVPPKKAAKIIAAMDPKKAASLLQRWTAKAGAKK